MFLLFIGGVLVYVVASFIIKGLGTVHWVPVSAVVEYANPNADHYDFILRYGYEVNGVEYVGTKYVFGFWPSPSQVKEITGRLRLGSSVTVYYDPNNPKSSVVKKGLRIPMGMIVPLILPLVMVLLGVFFIVKWRRGGSVPTPSLGWV